MLPVLGGEVVESQKHVTVLGQACRGLGIFRPVGFQEEVEGALGILPGFGHPDVLHVLLGLGRPIQTKTAAASLGGWCLALAAFIKRPQA